MAESKSKSRAEEAADLEEIRSLLIEIQKQNLLLKRYLYALGIALAILLLIQFFPSIITLIQVVVVVVLISIVLLTAPVWSRFMEQITDRLPWTSKWSTRKPH